MLLILAAFMSNTFGNRLRLTTWGESHGTAIGGVIDGFPSGFRIDNAMIDSDLRRRATGNLPSASSRKETDRVEFLSGLTDGMTLGTPIAFMIRNSDCHSGDYEELKDVFRPSHADYTYQAKYGLRDWRGGGRASARETAVRVVAGAMARQWLMEHGVTVSAFTSRVGTVHILIMSLMPPALPVSALSTGIWMTVWGSILHRYVRWVILSAERSLVSYAG